MDVEGKKTLVSGNSETTGPFWFEMKNRSRSNPTTFETTNGKPSPVDGPKNRRREPSNVRLFKELLFNFTCHCNGSTIIQNVKRFYNRVVHDRKNLHETKEVCLIKTLKYINMINKNYPHYQTEFGVVVSTFVFYRFESVNLIPYEVEMKKWSK